jgi:phage shock protein A
MNITQRFTLLVKCSLDAVLEKFEDPERALHQLVIDMEEELEAAKRAAARAMANEDRLRSRIALHEKDAREWEASAERALKKGDEAGARDMLTRAERAERQGERLAEELQAQARETADIREAVGRMHDRVRKARGRLELLQAKMRQGEARRAINKVLTGVERANLQSDFDRFSERIELESAAERSYFEIEDGLTGDDLRRRSEDAAVEDSVEERLERMREGES